MIAAVYDLLLFLQHFPNQAHDATAQLSQTEYGQNKTYLLLYSFLRRLSLLSCRGNDTWAGFMSVIYIVNRD